MEITCWVFSQIQNWAKHLTELCGALCCSPSRTGPCPAAGTRVTCTTPTAALQPGASGRGRRKGSARGWSGAPSTAGQLRAPRAARERRPRPELPLLLERSGDVPWKTPSGPQWCQTVTGACGLTWPGVPCPKAPPWGSHWHWRAKPPASPRPCPVPAARRPWAVCHSTAERRAAPVLPVARARPALGAPAVFVKMRSFLLPLFIYTQLFD